MTGSERGAADLLRAIGLLADGPVRWGARVPSRAPGLYVVELGAPLDKAPIEITKVGKWLERLPALRLDGEHPVSKTLAARIASFWWPDSTVLYAGLSDRSIGARVAALTAHVPGDRQPHADGQWLHLLRDLERLGVRIWWAETSAGEEYLDAFHDAFGEGRLSPPGRPAGALALPWANTRRTTGDRQVTGITGTIVPEPPRPPEPPRRVVEVAPGDAEGARTEDRGAGTTRRAPTPGSPAPSRATPPPRNRPTPAPKAAVKATSRPRKAEKPKAAAVELTQASLDRLREELDDLTQVKRREVVQRISSAREHGDLKENAEYHAARAEQSFLEGRVLALEDRLRRAVVIDQAVTGRVMLGSRVKIEVGGDELTYEIVGTTEADPANGRLSSASPVGAALLGAVAGAEVEVRTPRGQVTYRVLSVD